MCKNHFMFIFRVIKLRNYYFWQVEIKKILTKNCTKFICLRQINCV